MSGPERNTKFAKTNPANQWQAKQKPVARSVEIKLKKLRERLAEKETEQRILDYLSVPNVPRGAR